MKETTIPETIGNKRSVRTFLIDLLIMLAAPAGYACYQYGMRVVWMLCITIFSALLCEWLFSKLGKQLQEDGYLSALVTGILITLLMPASAPYWLPVAGTIFGVLIAKNILGGIGATPVSPAAAGFVFTALCWPELTFSYPPVARITKEMAYQGINYVSKPSLAQMLQSGQTVYQNLYNALEILIGHMPGPMGATCIAILIATGLYLFIRHTSAWLTSAGFIVSCAVIAFLFPRISGGVQTAMWMELSADSLLFCAFFLLPGLRMPKAPTERLLYGMLAGLFCMLFRYYSVFPEGAPFAVLLVNLVWPALSGSVATLKIRTKRNGVRRRRKGAVTNGES